MKPSFGLPCGHVPLSDLRVLVHQLRHGGTGLGRSTLGCFLKQPTELDLGLLFGLDGGLEADRAPGERIGPGVHGDPERSARQLLYVTLGDSGHNNRIGPVSDIRSTKRSTGRGAKRAYNPLNWEPVSGFEPLTCRLQDGCSAC